MQIHNNQSFYLKENIFFKKTPFPVSICKIKKNVILRYMNYVSAVHGAEREFEMYSGKTLSILVIKALDFNFTCHWVLYTLQAWFDPELRWNKSRYGWIDEISLFPNDVWVPDTVLLNK